MAEKAMTKAQLVAHIAEEVGISKKEAVAVLEALTRTAYEQAPNGFTIPGIGKLEVKERAARQMRNPRTGEQIQVPAKTVLRFRVAKAAKDALAE